MMPYLASTSLSATVRVEKATSHLLMIPDWTMNMDICDAINTDPLQAKEFVKAVKKRLQHKNPRVQFLALMLLETMIKNCGDFVHFQVVDREILSEMVKIVRKTDGGGIGGRQHWVTNEGDWVQRLLQVVNCSGRNGHKWRR